jgi:O-antigen ligase
MNFVSGTGLHRCRVALLAAAAAYLFLLPTGALSFWRSLAFATSGALTVAVVALTARSRGKLLSIGTAIPLSIAAWATWSIASLAWSVDPAFTAQELKGDVLWGLVTMAIFYVAATETPNGFMALAGTLLVGLAFWTALAAGFAMSAAGWDSRLFHRGEGAFATYLVTVSPFVALLLWQAPVGVATTRRSLLAAALLVGLLLVSARMSDNRILWIAFAASLIIIASCAGPRVPVFWKAGVGILVIVFVVLFVDAARQRAELVSPSDSSVAATLATDPRLSIWRHASDRISARPWHGYGYGLHILGREIGSDTGDAKIRHPHNLFVSQWLQTGAIGAALFVAMLGSVVARFLRFLSSRDVELTRFGALGLAVVTAFAIRNLTDDFFSRANGKLLFAACAILLGAGALRARSLAPAPLDRRN